jgi:lipocalin
MITSPPFFSSYPLELQNGFLELAAPSVTPFSQTWSLLDFNGAVTAGESLTPTTTSTSAVAAEPQQGDFSVPFFSALPQLQVTAMVPGQEDLPPVQTVDYVDLGRYDGLWYEVARTTNFFQIGCVATTATYGLLSESSVSVFNACYNVFSGQDESIAGVATVVDPQTNAKLKVSFDGVPTSGDYWIIDLVENTPEGDYTYAVVGEPTRNFVFILSRTPRANPEILDQLYANLEAQYYDVSKIRRSLQPPQFRDQLTAGGDVMPLSSETSQTNIFAPNPLENLPLASELKSGGNYQSWVGAVQSQEPLPLVNSHQGLPVATVEGWALGNQV